jgi:hypothetical protein
MKVVTVRDFRDHATEMIRSHDLLLITRDGLPAGFFVPWDQPQLPEDILKGIYGHLAEMARADREASGVTEDEVLEDFQAARRARR